VRAIHNRCKPPERHLRDRRYIQFTVQFIHEMLRHQTRYLLRLRKRATQLLASWSKEDILPQTQPPGPRPLRRILPTAKLSALESCVSSDRCIHFRTGYIYEPDAPCASSSLQYDLQLVPSGLAGQYSELCSTQPHIQNIFHADTEGIVPQNVSVAYNSYRN